MYLQGDIVQVSFDLSVGHEQRKMRPAVVVSADDFNLRSSMTMVAPITSLDNGYPMHVAVECESVYGWACVEQAHALDLEARRCRKVGEADAGAMSAILDRIGAMFGI